MLRIPKRRGKDGEPVSAGDCSELRAGTAGQGLKVNGPGVEHAVWLVMANRLAGIDPLEGSDRRWCLPIRIGGVGR